MFGKIKTFLVDKAFGLAFMRYDRDGSQTLNPNQLTSLVNDVFQLLKIQRQVSFIEVGIIMKMLDIDGDSQLTKDQAYNAVKGTLAKFGGIGGIMKYFGKTGSAQTIQASTTQKAIQNNNYVPPQQIDENMLNSLPPAGKNIPNQDINKKNNQSSWGGQNQAWGNQGQQNQQWQQKPQSYQGWGNNGQQAWGNQGQPTMIGQGQNQGWGNQEQNQGWGNQQPNQGWGKQQPNQGWTNWNSDK